MFQLSWGFAVVSARPMNPPSRFWVGSVNGLGQNATPFMLKGKTHHPPLELLNTRGNKNEKPDHCTRHVCVCECLQLVFQKCYKTGCAHDACAKNVLHKKCRQLSLECFNWSTVYGTSLFVP